MIFERSVGGSLSFLSKKWGWFWFFVGFVGFFLIKGCRDFDFFFLKRLRNKKILKQKSKKV